MPDIVIVGAGIMGSSIALELQRAGFSTLVLDKSNAIGAGSTSASSAVIRFGFSTKAGVVAAWESKHRWEKWADYLGVSKKDKKTHPLAHFHRTGMLFLESDGFPRDLFLGLMDEVGVPYEILDNAKLNERFPALNLSCFWPPRSPKDPNFFTDPDGEMDGWFTPDAGFINDPQLAAKNLMDAAVRHGAEVQLRSTVVNVIRNNERVTGVELADGVKINSPIVINAAGPWSSVLNRLAEVEDEMRITTRPLRQEVHSVNAPNQFSFNNKGALICDLDLGYYCVPRPEGTILTGGVEAECDPMNWIDNPDEVLLSPTLELFEAQVWRMCRRIPDIEIPRQPRGLAGVYDVTRDWLPIYDRTQLDGFYVAIGTSGNQFKNAPIVGQAIKELVLACESGHDHDYDPVQVSCYLTGETLDLGAFSRNRTDTISSGTVIG